MCLLNLLFQQTKTRFMIIIEGSPVLFEAGDFLFTATLRTKVC